MARKRKKALPPSRARYERSNPVVSLRVDKELYDRLKGLQRVSGKSVADVLREAVGQQEATANNAYEIGYEDAIDWADDTWRVDYRCSGCGGTMTIDSEKEKAVAAEYLRKKGWAHEECQG